MWWIHSFFTGLCWVCQVRVQHVVQFWSILAFVRWNLVWKNGYEVCTLLLTWKKRSVLFFFLLDISQSFLGCEGEVLCRVSRSWVTNTAPHPHYFSALHEIWVRTSQGVGFRVNYEFQIQRKESVLWRFLLSQEPEVRSWMKCRCLLSSNGHMAIQQDASSRTAVTKWHFLNKHLCDIPLYEYIWKDTTSWEHWNLSAIFERFL